MNTVSMTGTLTKDPELKGGETKVCRMRLAELNGGDSLLFINVAAFGRQATSCNKHLAKGRHVAVSGRLRMREWEDEDGGQKHTEYSIAADRVDFLPGGKRRSGDSGEGDEDE
jgi:single-strand DNA-binding protein